MRNDTHRLNPLAITALLIVTFLLVCAGIAGDAHDSVSEAYGARATSAPAVAKLPAKKHPVPPAKLCPGWKALDKHQKANVRIIVRVARSRHLSDTQIVALLKLCRRESTFHARSHSRSSECHGLFQLSRNKAHGRRWWIASWNTKRALVYIKARYGTPTAALAHSYRYGWY